MKTIIRIFFRTLRIVLGPCQWLYESGAIISYLNQRLAAA